MHLNQKELSQFVKAEAKRLGFSDCGISKVAVLESENEKLQKWLDKSFQGELSYMERNQDLRKDIRLLVPGARSVISVLLNYYPGDIEYPKNHPKISKYALGRDYHKVMKKMLKALFFSIQEKMPEMEGRFFVDSAPVMDKAWAQKSGLGWMGKNTNMIHKKIGSFFFIGEIVCNLDMEADSSIEGRCGTCTKCIDACPTNAIIEPYHLDAKRCISYQTIEKKTDIDPDIAPKLNNFIFGCDICQDVCPWNRRAKASEHPEIGSKKEWIKFSFQDFLEMEEDTFNNIFAGAPIRRAGLEKIQRTIRSIFNVNSENPD